MKHIIKLMGGSSSALEKEIGADFPINEKYFGLVNYGNTCYCNSVLQALYFCKPFRDNILSYRPVSSKKGNKENLLTCLNDLFSNINQQKKRTGVIHPKKFVARLRKENESFDNYLQQDAHEFLNFLLNTIADILRGEKLGSGSQLNNSVNGLAGSLTSASAASKIKGLSQSGDTLNAPAGELTPGGGSNPSSNGASKTLCNGMQSLSLGGDAQTTKHNSSSHSEPSTWIHDIFQGVLTNETICLSCESVTTKDEDFLDLSIDVEQNTSITQCLRDFSHTETLCADQKFYCETCCSKQEARKRMRIKKLPQVLAIHLKRFKYTEQLGRYTKLSYRVAFPLELRLFNTLEECENADQLYELVGVVVHCGSSPNRGHYISIVKSHDLWLLFDDDNIDTLNPHALEEFFGHSVDTQKPSEAGYILFYQVKSI